MSTVPPILLAIKYEEYAQEYLRSLPLEHFTESVSQAYQRAITLACLLIVAGRRRGFPIFSELLVQYERKRRRRPGQVVPDNMVVLTEERVRAKSSYNVPFEPVGPFWTLEYVSQSNKRKDYDDNFKKYERELKVPYHLLFEPDEQKLTLYHHNGRRYVVVRPNENGRLAIPEVEIEVAILDSWLRYWYQGELLPLPDELDRQLQAEKRRADQEKRRADELQRRLEETEAELARLRAQQGNGGRRRRSP